MTAPPLKQGSSGCTCMRLRKASRRVSQIYDRSLEPLGLTVTQFSLLGHLGSFDGIGIGALAEKLVMDPTTLTRNLRPLQRQGFVVLAADPHDRRVPVSPPHGKRPEGLPGRQAGLGPRPTPCRQGAR